MSQSSGGEQSQSSPLGGCWTPTYMYTVNFKLEVQMFKIILVIFKNWQLILWYNICTECVAEMYICIETNDLTVCTWNSQYMHTQNYFLFFADWTPFHYCIIWQGMSDLGELRVHVDTRKCTHPCFQPHRSIQRQWEQCHDKVNKRLLAIISP